MKKLTLILTLSMLFASVVHAGSEKTPEQGKESQIIYRAWSQKSFKGPEDLFAGDVQVDILFPSNETAHYSGELATICALANMTGTEGQLRFHLGAAMNTGLTQAQMKDFISVIATRIDKKKAEDADEVLNTVLNGRE